MLQLLQRFVLLSPKFEVPELPNNLASLKVYLARAEVHHQILSLPDTWLKMAMLIFSHLVIFPLNPKLQLCAKYSSRLRQQLIFDVQEVSGYLRL